MFKLLTKVFAAWKRQPGTAPPAADAATPPARAEVREAAPAAPAPVADSRKEETAPARPGVPPPVSLPGEVDGGWEEEQIRVRAYFLAEAAGFPDGREAEFWHQAAREIRGARGSRNGPTATPHPASREVRLPGGC
jgi:hypothetical protein